MTLKTTLKTLLLLTLSAGVCENVNAQWAPIKSMGGGPTDGCFSFSLNGKGYVGGGSNGSHVRQYDTTTNVWTLKGNAPGNKTRGFGFAFSAHGKGYAGCGSDAMGAMADMWMYNDTANSWTPRADFPGGKRNAMLCFVINDTAYIGGGFDSSGGEWDDFYKYDPFNDTWTQLAYLPMGAVGFPSSFVIGNKGYLVTGMVGTTESNGLWEYNPATDTWTSKTAFPGAARQTAFAFTINSYGYVGGGMSQYDTVFTDMWRYNSITDGWTPVEKIPSQYPAWACAFTVGNTAYVGTGVYFSTAGLPGTDSFKRYRGIANTTGITTTSNNSKIELYPNPANDHITIDVANEPGSVTSITDITGREVKTFTGAQNTLYIGDLQKGIYLVKYTGSSGVATGKFVKQ